ncbi:MAG: nucleotide exchange factor GrpE [Patescibacteria group bacterium]|nr:nucleotide exchange factor GrpE [Patescibacteria group bacterium]
MGKNKTDKKENSSINSGLEEDQESKTDWEKKAAEYLNGWKRARADYLNLKKEKDKEREEIMKFSNAALIIQLLPIYDHLKIAFDHVPKDLKNNEWVKGIEGIKKQTQDFIESIGIKEIKTVGEKFDPEKHEAVAHEKNKDFKTDIIFEETKPGYKLHDKVLYPAKVKVAK